MIDEDGMQTTKRTKPIHSLTLAGLLAATPIAQADADLVALGKALFFDATLSEPPGQSCASCHAPIAGWSSPDSAINAAGGVHEGAVSRTLRQPPSTDGRLRQLQSAAASR
jgi:cytochrome c peroxidase